MSGRPSISAAISWLMMSSPGSAPALRDQVLQIGVQLTAGAADGLAGSLARPAELGVVLADDLVGPRNRSFQSSPGHAEDPGDHPDGERGGHPLDEIELLVARGRPDRPAPRRRCGRSRRGVTGCARGVKRGMATRRNGPWRGGSSMTTISDGGAGAPGWPRMRPWALENRSGWEAISVMSACLVMAQKDTYPGGLEVRPPAPLPRSVRHRLVRVARCRAKRSVRRDRADRWSLPNPSLVLTGSPDRGELEVELVQPPEHPGGRVLAIGGLRRGPWWASEIRMSSVRSSRRWTETLASARASGAPAQVWMPWPKAMCWRPFFRSSSQLVGRSNSPRVAVGGAGQHHDRRAGRDLGAADRRSAPWPDGTSP